MSNAQRQVLVHIRQHNIALLFANYLATLHIVTEIITEQEGYAIYCAEQDVVIAKQHFVEFIQQPQHPKYQNAAWQHGDVSQVHQDGPPFWQTFQQEFLAHAGVVTLVVFICCWLVFLGRITGWGEMLFQQLQFYPRLSWLAVLQEPYRLVGPALYHFSWLHIVFNTMWWWQLGGSTEQVLGKVTLMQLFVVSAIISNLGQFLVSGPAFGGLSGVVYALVGFVWWVGWLAPEKGLTLSQPIVGILLFWLLLGFLDVLPVDVANTAHLLGLVSGCLFAWLKVKTSGFRQKA